MVLNWFSRRQAGKARAILLTDRILESKRKLTGWSKEA